MESNIFNKHSVNTNQKQIYDIISNGRNEIYREMWDDNLQCVIRQPMITKPKSLQFYFVLNIFLFLFYVIIASIITCLLKITFDSILKSYNSILISFNTLNKNLIFNFISDLIASHPITSVLLFCYFIVGCLVFLRIMYSAMSIFR